MYFFSKKKCLQWKQKMKPSFFFLYFPNLFLITSRHMCHVVFVINKINSHIFISQINLFINSPLNICLIYRRQKIIYQRGIVQLFLTYCPSQLQLIQPYRLNSIIQTAYSCINLNKAGRFAPFFLGFQGASRPSFISFVKFFIGN